MPGGGVADGFRCELLLLQLRVRRHAALAISPGEIEHAVVQRVEAGERDELESVAHGAKLALERRDRRWIQEPPPVE